MVEKRPMPCGALKLRVEPQRRALRAPGGKETNALRGTETLRGGVLTSSRRRESGKETNALRGTETGGQQGDHHDQKNGGKETNALREGWRSQD
jgi:hypothetical protein